MTRGRALTFEALESRRLLAVWDGGGAAGSWHDPLNWASDVLPAAGEDVVIGQAFAGDTIQLTASASIGALTSAASLNVSGGTLTIAEESEIGGTFTLAGGTLTGAGDLTLTSDGAWTSGTMLGAGKLIVDDEASFTISGTGVKSLSRELENAGETTYAGSGLRYGAAQFAPGTITNLIGATFTALGDAVFGFTWQSVHAFNNFGTFVHSGSGTAVFVVAKFHNYGGRIETSGGVVQLGDGGSLSGSSTIDGGRLQVTGGTLVAAGGALTGTGALELASTGRLEVSAATSVERLTLTSGQLVGAADLTVSGQATWTGASMLGSGKTIVGPGASMVVSGEAYKQFSRVIENAGSITLNQASLAFGAVQFGTARINNLAGAVFTAIGSSASLGTNWTSQDHAFDNAGTFVRTGAGSTTISGIQFINDGGDVQVDQGVVNLASGGSFAGDSTLTSGSVRLTGGTLTIADETTIAGAGVLENVGGTISVAGAASLENLALTGGTLTGVGDLTLTGESTWTAGSMTGTGKLIVADEASLALAGAGDKYLSRILENAGFVTYADGGLQFGASQFAVGTIDNLAGGLFTVQGEADVSFWWPSTAHAFNNQGTFVHAGVGTTAFSGVLFNNDGGAVRVDDGIVQLASGGSFAEDSTLTSGSVRLTGGTLTIADETLITGAGVLENSGGTISVAGAASLSNLAFAGGTLTGGGDLTLTGESTWTAGSMTGAGKLIVADEASLALAGAGDKYLSRILENAGVVTYADGGLLFGAVQFGIGTINNLAGASFTVHGEADIGYTWDSSAHAFNNQGAFVHGGLGTTAFSGVLFNNNGGTVRVDDGIVQLASGGSFAGDSTLTSGLVRLTGGTLTIVDETSITGAGVLENSGGIVSVAGGASLENLAFTGGTLTGAGNLTLTGESSWTAGSMTGAGKLIVADEATLSLAGAGGKYLSRVLENAGFVTYADGGLLFGAVQFGTGTINNLPGGSFTVHGEADVSFSWDSSAHALNNQGTFVHTGLGTTAFSGVLLNNDGGIVRVDDGIVQLASGGSFSGMSVLAAGKLRQTGGTVSVAADTTIAGDGVLEIAAGSLTVLGGASLSNLALTGGTLTGGGNLTLTGESTWTAGSMTGAGKLIVAEQSTLALSWGGFKYLSRILENAGFVTYADGGLLFGAVQFGTGTINNLVGGSFTVHGEADLSYWWDSSLHAFNNQGTFVHAGFGTTAFSGVLFNSNGGTVRVDSGQLLTGFGSASTFNGSHSFSSGEFTSLLLPAGVSGNTTNAAGFYPLGTIDLRGGALASPSLIEAFSEDRGAVADGWRENFAFGRLFLNGGVFRVVNSADNSAGLGAEAVYVEQLVVGGGSTLQLNGLNVYTSSLHNLGTIEGGSVTVVPGATIPTPRVAFAASSQTVDENANILAITVTLAAPADRELHVPLTLAGNATPGVDFQLLTPEVTFAPGSTTAIVQVEIIDDSARESDEGVILNLAPVGGVRTGQINSHLIVIEDDDTPPGVHFEGFSQILTEGGVGLVTVRLEEISAFDVTVPLLLSGSATNGVDYTLAATTIVIPAGSQQASVDVTIADDVLGEIAENVVVKMGVPINAIPSTRLGVPLTHTVTIPANDKPTVSFVLPSSAHAESAGQVQVEVRLSNPLANDIAIPLSYSASTTSAGDFASPGLPGSVFFAAQSTIAYVTLNILDDATIEAGEALAMKVAATTDVAVGRYAQHMFGIVDNERRLAQFTAASQVVWEDTASISAGTVNATISIPAANPTDIWFKVKLSGTAASNDYAIQNSDVNAGRGIRIPAGQTSVTIPIRTVNDATNEKTERLTLTLDDSEYTTALGMPSNLGGRKSFSMDITDDDLIITFSGPFTSVSEGNPQHYTIALQPSGIQFQLIATLSAPTNKNIVVPLTMFSTVGGRTVAHGTASASDFQPLAPAIGIVAGKTSGTASVALLFSDFLDEPNETVVLKFGTPVGGGNLKSSSFTYTITDDDKPPYVYLATANTSLSEANKSQSIVVRVSSLSANDVYVPIVFSGTAVRGTDYNASGLDSSLRLKIPAGTREASFTIKTADDSRYEGSESIIVAIGKSPVNASQSSTKSELTRTLTITDNESPPIKATPVPGTLALDPNAGGSIAPGALGTSGGIVINSPGSITIPGTLAIETGLLNGATFFLDANFNGVQDFLDLNANGVRDEGDLDEPTATSLGNGMGSFEIDVRFDLNRDLLITPDEGRWVAVGGVDTSTGLPSRVPLAAPLGMYAVTPLSTLQEALVRLHGFSVVDAEARVREALQVEGETLAITSLPHAIIAGDVRAAAIYSQVVQLSNVTLAIAELFAGVPAALPLELFAEHAYRAIADRLAAPDATLDLIYEAVIADLIEAVARETGVALHGDPVAAEAITQGAATILSQGNLAIAALPAAGNAAFLTALSRIKKVIQGDAAAALRSVTAGAANVAQVVTEFTGANLQGRIAAASSGSLPLPSIVVSDATVVEGDNGQSVLEFNVEIIGDHTTPVSVDFTTIDDELNPGGGSYVPKSGTLTWAAGDVTPRTVQVLVQSDNAFELNERVLLRLAAATNAVVISEVGYGQVINDDVLTIDLPSGGPSTAHIDLGSELLVLVNDEFVHNGPLAGPLEAYVTGNDTVADELAIEFSAGTSSGEAIVFTAGGGAAVDALRLHGGNFATIVHSFQDAKNGSTVLQAVDGDETSSVQWQGLEVASLGFNDAGSLTFSFSSAVTSVILEDADPADADPALAGKMRIRSATQQFSPVVFNSSVGALKIRGSLSTGDVVVASTDPRFVAAVQVVSDALPGDYDGDGKVDAEDLPVWKSGFGQSVSSGSIAGDGDRDGDVDGSDFLLWQRNLGSTSNSMTISSLATAPTGAGDSAATLRLASVLSTTAHASDPGWLAPLATKQSAFSTIDRTTYRPRPAAEMQLIFAGPASGKMASPWRVESADIALRHLHSEASIEADASDEQLDQALTELQSL